MRVILRPYCDADAAAFAAAVNASLDTLRPWLLWAHENFTEAEARSWFAATHTLRSNGEADELGLFAEDGRLLGGAGLRYSSQQPELCSIGYWVRSSEQRKGVATQAVRNLLERAWRDSKIEVIEILAVEQNRASCGVAEKCGAERVGVKYGLIVLENGPASTAIYHLYRP